MAELSGIAIVTGAAGGIGKELVAHLAACGMRVHGWGNLADWTPSDGTVATKIDIADREQVEAEVGKLPEAPALLVNNAAYVRYAPALELGPDDWERSVAVNLNGSYWCARAAANRMKQAGGGAIIQITSVAAERANVHSVAYAASKAGALQMTRVMAVELAPHGVRVNAISPGTIATPLVDATLTGAGRESRMHSIPLQRFGEPEDIAAAVEYLASDRARYITGVTLPVDGGFMAAGVSAR